MKNRKFFVVLALAFCMTSNVFALECTVKYDTASNELRLTGIAEAPVTVLVVPEDADTSLLTTENPPVAGAQYNYHGKTEFDETIRLNANLPSGLYHVTLQSNETIMAVSETETRLYGQKTQNSVVLPYTINHVSATDGSALLIAANDTTDDADALYALIETGETNETSNTSLLEVDPEEFAVYGEYACKQIVGTKKGADFTDINELVSLLKEYEVLYQASKATTATEAVNVLKNHASVLSADVKRFILDLDSKSATKFFALIKNFEANGVSFSQEIPKLSALASVQAADRWQTMKAIITDTYADVLEIDHTNTKNIDSVFAQMMEYSYHTYGDIEDNFDKADAAVNPKKSKYPTTSGGGGGGGGGVTTDFVLAPTRPEQRDEPARENLFFDVPADFWGHQAISALAERNIISGYPDGNFLPEGNVTRAEFVKMLVSAFDIKADGEISFADVSENDWYYSYIRSAYCAGIVSGVSDDAFDPNGAITREDACVIVYRYLSGNGVLNANKADFEDQAYFAPYASDAIKTLSGNGIVNGVGNNRFDAKETINRASCAVLILNCINAM